MANFNMPVVARLADCIGAPSHTVPSVQYRIANFNFPFDFKQNAFFMQDQINPFALNASNIDASGLSFEQSSELIADTFSLTAPFILMGICIYAYGEPFGFALDANAFGPQKDIEALPNFPGSPTLLRTNPNALAQLGLFIREDGWKVCQAQLDWGNPTWRAVWAFLHAFRIQVDCPNTASGEYIVNEALADIGNCCSHAIPEGFGAGKTNWIKYVRLVNERLKQIQDAGLGAGPLADPDRYILPFNVDQSLMPGATTLDYSVDPYRQPVDFAAYGREFMNPTIEQWYRMGTPVKLLPDTKIRINLKPSTGSNMYRTRFLNEANIECCVSPIPGMENKGDVNLREVADKQLVSLESAKFCKVPGGLWRFGVALKGFFVKPQVCAELDACAYQTGCNPCGSPGEVVR